MYFKDAVGSDVAELVSLINAAYRPSSDPLGWTDERGLLEGTRTDPAMVAEELATGRFLLLRLTPDGPMVACALVTVEADDAWYVSSIAVDPSRQSNGFGAALLGEVERQAGRDGARRLRITVIRQRETLIAWYERRGFARTGTVLPFPYDEPRVGRPARSDLALIVLEKLIGE